MKLALLTILLVFSSISFGQSKLKQGNWIGELELNKEDKLPFNIIIAKKKENYSLSILNANELILLDTLVYKNDSVYARFPYFDSELIFEITDSKSLNGYWINYNKGNNYKIPFTAISNCKKKKKEKKIDIINGKWEVTFEPGTSSAYPAIGIFKQNKHTITGTFLTETGDYRFLEGHIFNDSLILSCFDGSHAFLFKASLNNSSLQGKFFSGKHWQSNWIGHKNDSAKLKSPDELTYIVDKQAVEFELPQLNGETFLYPNGELNDKVVIIQIMGTWCPNCLDETFFYKDLYTKYHDQGLEIISIGYEMGDSFEDYAAKVSRLKNKMNLNFKFLIGGPANKSIVSEQFNMLNKVISFPTSIYIGRDGMVKRVHTGFNGPGTGGYYKEYVENTHSLIENLLAD
ncbi:MAG: TlpA family protein disulfide reductase [Crocinitomicaceae bacterium]|nr:TlpA family protein disulfide reductase [Crocinitomicaceae bacterium]